MASVSGDPDLRNPRSHAGGRRACRPADAVTLLEEGNLLALGAAANTVRNRKNDPGVATYIVDRNINYTNVCVYRCQFCAFYRPSAEHPEAYVLSHEQIGEKIQETIDLGGTGRAAAGRRARGPAVLVLRGDVPVHPDDVPDDPPPRAVGAGGLLPPEDHEVADARRDRAAEGRRAPVDPRRRRRDPRGLGAQAHLVADQGADREVGRRARVRARPRHAHDGDDDVRRGGDLRAARRAHRGRPRPAGPHGRLHRLDPLDVPEGEHRARRQGRRGRRLRVPEDARRLAPLPRQRPARPGLVGHAGAEDRAGVALLRRRRPRARS